MSAFRHKRKLSDTDSNIMSEISEIRKQMTEMMSLITAMSTNQSENISKLCDDVNDIKTQINHVSNNIDVIRQEQEIMKSEVTNLKTAAKVTEEKVERLEADITKLTQTNQNKPSCEDVITECLERYIRAKNIIITGIQEAVSKNVSERFMSDKQEIMKVIRKIDINCPEPKQIVRLGKYQPNKIRPIKALFATEETAKLILRQKINTPLDNVIIYSDRTPYQRDLMEKLKLELQHRAANGETNLTIKYVKGVPKIL